MAFRDMPLLVEQIRGVSYKPEDVHDRLDASSITLLRANNIVDGAIELSDVVYVDRKCVTENQILRRGDILICASSGSKNLVGKAAQFLLDGEYTFGAFCKVVRPKEAADFNYISMFFQSPAYRREISSVAIGVNINNIRNEHIDSLRISWPDADARKAIVAQLQSLMAVMQNRQRQLRAFDTLIKARFVEMFGDPATNPMQWPETIVGQECYYIKDGPHKSLPDVGIENGGHPFISVRNIVNHVIDFSTARYISDEDFIDARKKCRPEKGDMLYSKGGTTGIAKLIDVDIEFANWVHLAVLKFDRNKLDGVFFENMLNCDYCYEQSQKLTKGIANRDLVLSSMAQIKMYRPPLNLQKQFASFVSQVDKSKVVVQRALEKAQLLFDSLMQEYFG